MTLTELDPGPFAPLVGYVGAILAAAYLVGVLWRGRTQPWRSPDEDLPGTVQKVFGLLSGIGIVGLWLYTTPETMKEVFRISVYLGIILLIGYLAYAFSLGALVLTRYVAVSSSAVKAEKVVGGIWLKSAARTSMKKNKVRSRQTLFEGASYEPDFLWSRTSRGVAKTFLLFLFIVIMVSGTLAISGAGFAVQVRLTGKAAAEVIDVKNAPGADTKKSSKP
jgi:hypothetical protein